MKRSVNAGENDTGQKRRRKWNPPAFVNGGPSSVGSSNIVAQNLGEQLTAPNSSQKGSAAQTKERKKSRLSLKKKPAGSTVEQLSQRTAVPGSAGDTANCNTPTKIPVFSCPVTQYRSPLREIQRPLRQPANSIVTTFSKSDPISDSGRGNNSESTQNELPSSLVGQHQSPPMRKKTQSQIPVPTFRRISKPDSEFNSDGPPGPISPASRGCPASQGSLRNPASRKSCATRGSPVNRGNPNSRVAMGFSKQPSIAHYWNRNNDFYGMALIQCAMTRDRFQLLLAFIHFADNEAPRERNDRRYKISFLLDLLNRNFASVLSPGLYIIIDESLVLFRGRLIFRQYNKGKKAKYGMKLYKLCSELSYTLATLLCCGKGTIPDEGKGHGHAVVMELSQDYLDCGRTLIVDNFYTSLPLAEDLLERKTLLCGTLRADRKGLPKEFMTSVVKKGESVGVQCNHGTKVIRWTDKRTVNVLTTVPEHTEEIIDTGRRRYNDQPIEKPAPVILYNEKKKGVDVADQLLSYYSSLRKGLKWYRKLGLHFLTGICVTNAYLLRGYTNTGLERMHLLEFRETLARSLISVDPFVVRTLRSRRRIHTLKEYDGPVRKVGKRCRSCYQALTRTMSSRAADRKCPKVRTYCSCCTGAPPMCLTCFNRNHKS